jgi:hypothetical protein
VLVLALVLLGWDFFFPRGAVHVCVLFILGGQMSVFCVMWRSVVGAGPGARDGSTVVPGGVEVSTQRQGGAEFSGQGPGSQSRVRLWMSGRGRSGVQASSAHCHTADWWAAVTSALSV